MIVIETIEKPVKRITCPSCHEKIKGVGLIPGSHINGLTFKCRRCGKLWEIKEDEKERRRA